MVFFLIESIRPYHFSFRFFQLYVIDISCTVVIASYVMGHIPWQACHFSDTHEGYHRFITEFYSPALFCYDLFVYLPLNDII